MERIESFQIDHTRLQRGLYVSRQDSLAGGGVATTFDIRVCRPYFDYVLDGAAAHTIEHLGATFLRTRSFFADRVIYFGPMGCHTGFYLVIDGKLEVEDVKGTVREMFAWMATFEGPIPGGTEQECGNADYHDVTEARRVAHQYYNEVLLSLDESNTVYPKNDIHE